MSFAPIPVAPDATAGATDRSSRSVPPENATLQLAAAFDRITYPPRGRDGGHNGARGIVRLSSGRALNGKGEQDIPPDETLQIESPGGGGYGDPAARDPALIAADLRSGLVTPAAAAKRDYGYDGA